MTAHDDTAFAEPLAHPGEPVREDVLSDYGLTPGALADAASVASILITPSAAVADALRKSSGGGMGDMDF